MTDLSGIERLPIIPNQPHGTCFGCGRINQFGLQMKFHSDGNKVFSKLQIPSHLSGWVEVAHGGVVSTVLDETMAWTAIWILKKFILTKTMTVDFLKKTPTEDFIYSEGEITEVSEREAKVSAHLYNSEFRLCARSTSVMAVFTPEEMKKRKLLREDLIEDFVREVFIDSECSDGI